MLLQDTLDTTLDREGGRQRRPPACNKQIIYDSISDSPETEQLMTDGPYRLYRISKVLMCPLLTNDASNLIYVRCQKLATGHMMPADDSQK